MFCFLSLNEKRIKGFLENYKGTHEYEIRSKKGEVLEVSMGQPGTRFFHYN